MRPLPQALLALFFAVIIGIIGISFLFAQTRQPRKSVSKTPPKRAATQADSLNNLGVGYMNQQQFAKALKYFEQAYAANPKLLSARLNQGIALLNLQRLDAARGILIEVTRRDPTNARAWYNLGLLYRSDAKPEPALQAFQHVAQLDPNDADTFYFMGTIYAQLKRYPQAIAAFQKVLQLNPYHASAEFGLARAYQPSGDSVHAREHLARFQQVTKSKLGAAMSIAYGEQGPYSLAASSSATVEPVLPQIPVHFVSVTEQSGLWLQAPGAWRKNTPFIQFAGPGACFFDYDGDGRIDLFIPSGGKQGGMALYRNLGGHFSDMTEAAGLDPKTSAISCTAGDYDNDGFTDLAIGYPGHVNLYHNEKNGKFRDVTEASKIQTDGLPLGMTFIDYDHDGDLDLYITRTANFEVDDPREALVIPSEQARDSNLLWRNNGDGSFTDVTEATGLGGTAASIAAVGTDFNNDRAIDFVVTGAPKSPTVFVNPREGKFPATEPWSAPFPAPTVGVAVLDFNKDGWMDLAFTHWGAPGLSLWRNVEGKKFEPVPLPKLNWVRGWGVVALDYDNDGWIDLAAVGETAEGRGEVRLFRNLGPKGFKDVSAEVGLDKLELHNPRALVAADYDADGATDLLITQNKGPLVLLHNQGATRNNWLRIALKGLNDNKSAIGTKVEVFAGALHQKWEVQGGSSYLGQNSPEITAGLARETSVDVLRLLWPTGVVQDEVELAARRQQNVMEIDRRGSSCPTLFAWDGRHFDFIADMIGAGVVGHWVGPGQRNTPRPTEYVKVDGDRIRLRNGKLSFRFMEPMEEVVYLDQVRLLAIDHPKDVAVYPNEYFASNPPYPEFKVIASRDARPPAGAWDDKGRDVLSDLLQRDRRYVRGFEMLQFPGFAKLHTLELDLGEVYQSGPLRLLLHGFVDYFSANSMYAADQAGIHVIDPYVEALGPDGKWVRVMEDMGFPAGLPRTMVADLSGRLPSGTRRIRIRTNLQIYWDQILVDRTASMDSIRVAPVPVASAELRFHGYPRQVEGNPPGDLDFRYHEVSTTGPYAREAGNYTRFGDVRSLVEKSDDRFVVFGSGEEIALEFDPGRLRDLPPGWTRDYFFMADGYEKDMDFYAAEANTVDPLPFHAMGAYPYAKSRAYPADDDHLKYLLDYNTRPVSGKEPREYRFQFESRR